MALRSMTGFGAGDAPLGPGRITVEARSVNHRFLDLRVRVPKELLDHGLYLEQSARRRLPRGRVELNVHAEGLVGAAVALDRERARGALRALRALCEEEGLGLAEAPPWALLAGVPELFTNAAPAPPEAARVALDTALSRCLDALEAMRAREGEALAVDLAARAVAVRTLLGELVSHAEGMVPALHARLRERVLRAARGAGLTLDAARVEQELVLAAEHTDVTEELTRLGSHLEQFEALLEAAEPVGRRLDFLLQEMSREANTLGAKACDPGCARRVVELKAELERMREQAQNVE